MDYIDISLIKELRLNSRQSLARISKKTNIPISTLFERLKKLEDDVITRHVSIVDFSKLGYFLKVHFTMSTKQKDELRFFLKTNRNVNSAFTIMNGTDYYVECIFKNINMLNEFKENLKTFEVMYEEAFVLEESLVENFTP
ncbi:Lrp/AsnC family transcriptional regulator [Nanoarchaeota archaeon]